MQLISVIISSYNAEKTLSQALDAFEKQDIGKDNFEVIIVDDGSADGSKELIKKYIKKNTFTLKYYYQENKWVGIARNHGIKYAQGDILAFTDADCICDRDWLSVIQKTIREEKKYFIWWYTYCNDTVIFPWKMAPVNQQGITANLAIDYRKLSKQEELFNSWFTWMFWDDVDFVLRMEEQWYAMTYITEMRVLHPVNILTFERFLIRWKWRMNEVGLYKKHGKKALNCFSFIFKPFIFWRISLFTISFIISVLLLIIIWQSYWLLWIITAILFVFISFILFGYKAFIIHHTQWKIITLTEKTKTFFFFLLTIPLFFKARIQWMIKFNFFLL
jgi:glycosyltransferase involved in cell wall biosynthesis